MAERPRVSRLGHRQADRLDHAGGSLVVQAADAVQLALQLEEERPASAHQVRDARVQRDLSQLRRGCPVVRAEEVVSHVSAAWRRETPIRRRARSIRPGRSG